jgi:hypothetical protein
MWRSLDMAVYFCWLSAGWWLLYWHCEHGKEVVGGNTSIFCRVSWWLKRKRDVHVWVTSRGQAIVSIASRVVNPKHDVLRPAVSKELCGYGGTECVYYLTQLSYIFLFWVFVFMDVTFTGIYRFNVCGSVHLGNISFIQIQLDVQYSFVEKFSALHVSDVTCIHGQQHSCSVQP